MEAVNPDLDLMRRMLADPGNALVRCRLGHVTVRYVPQPNPPSCTSVCGEPFRQLTDAEEAAYRIGGWEALIGWPW